RVHRLGPGVRRRAAGRLRTLPAIQVRGVGRDPINGELVVNDLSAKLTTKMIAPQYLMIDQPHRNDEARTPPPRFPVFGRTEAPGGVKFEFLRVAASISRRPSEYDEAGSLSSHARVHAPQPQVHRHDRPGNFFAAGLAEGEEQVHL